MAEDEPKFACRNVDLATSEGVKHCLDRTIAQYAAIRTSGSWSSAGNARARKAADAVLTAVKRESGSENVSLRALYTKLNQVPEEGMGMGARLFRSSTREERDAKRAQEAIPEDVHEHVNDLVREWDPQNLAHCSEDFSDEEERTRHEEWECPFRRVTCEHEGCGETFSAHHRSKHDAICPHKPLNCPLECGASVERRRVTEHKQIECANRPATCPFHSLGCDRAYSTTQAELKHKEVEDHIREAVFSHLHLLHASHLVHHDRLEEGEKAIASLRQEVQNLTGESKGVADKAAVEAASATAAVKTLQERVRAAEEGRGVQSQLKQMARRLDALEKEDSNKKKEIGGLRDEVQRERTWRQSLERQLATATQR